MSRQLSDGIGDTTVLMVSHDAAFLDAVATDIIHFRLKHLTYYAGNYTAYMKVKVGRRTAGRVRETLPVLPGMEWHAISEYRTRQHQGRPRMEASVSCLSAHAGRASRAPGTS